MTRSTKNLTQHIVNLRKSLKVFAKIMDLILILTVAAVLLVGTTACTRFIKDKKDTGLEGHNTSAKPAEISENEPGETGDEKDGSLENAPDSEKKPVPETEKVEEPNTQEPGNEEELNNPENKPGDAGSGIADSGQTPVSTPKPSPTPKPSATPKPTPTPAPEPILPSGIVNPYVKYTYEQMMEESRKLQEKYPDILSTESIGSSVEGKDILLIKLGLGEKKILLCGAHHAREYITSSYLMKMTEEYARYYTENKKFGNYNVKNLLDNVTLYIVPMVNPDGVNLVNKGLSAVANKEDVEAMALVRPTYREWKANINGVDLNRQYPAHWEEKYDNVGKPASENYKGTAAATEPEVQAMMALSEENDFILAASFHTKGNAIYWADRGTVNEIPGVEAMTKRLASLTKYQRMPISEKPSIYGAGYENWFRLKFKRPAFCIELTPYNGTDVPHDDSKFDKLVWNNARYIGLFLADEAIKR